MLPSSQISVNDQPVPCLHSFAYCFAHCQPPAKVQNVACFFPQNSASIAMEGKQLASQDVWRKLTVDASPWSDNRLNKTNARYTNFVNIITKDALSTDDSSNAIWQSELASRDQAGVYTDCGATAACPQDFSEICRDSLSNFCDGGWLNKALQAVEQQDVFVPSVIFSRLLQLCIKEDNLAAGRQVHCLIVGCGYEADVFVGSCLVHMFASLGSSSEANQVFSKLSKPNMFSWSAIIQAHANHGENAQAIKLYHEMHKSIAKPDGHIFVAVLKACSSIATLEHGKQVHTCIIESGLEVDVFVGSTLINMYAKCGSLNEAYMVFDRLPKRNVVTWSALIKGYVEHDHAQDALQLFQQMQKEGIKPNEVTYICLLKACSSIAALEHGKQIQSHIIECGFEADLFVGNTLIDMYSKCGNLEDACVVFNRLPEQDVVTWSALIAGYAQHGDYESSLRYFEDMKRQGVRPNGVTYLCLLSACSHVGLLDTGCLHFKLMREDYGIVPTLEHYNSMVDLLGKAGYLDEAEDLLHTLRFGSDFVGWISLLDSCRVRGDVNRGRRCFEHIVTMENHSALGYVVMSNIYAHAGMWEDVEKIQELRRCANLWKKPAKAFIEINNEVHGFIVGDTRHPRTDDIYAKLKTLRTQIREEGYTPCLESVMESISDGDKEDALCGHCEKLAIAFGLISTPQGTTIRVAKNLRVCTDCHNVAKLISKIEMREIIITDAYRIHNFKDGACCCRD